MTKKKTRPLSEAELTVLLQERYAAPEYAFMPQVRNGTGYSRGTTRTADAVAMSLWPSRGLELLGFEMKSARHDWMREKADPEKMEEIGKFCDRWWLVVGAEDIVQPGELPPTWGLLVPGKKGLVAKAEAPKLDAKPLDRAQLAAILRRAAECVGPRAEVRAALAREKEKLEESFEARVAIRTRSIETQLQELQTRVSTFEQLSGIRLQRWDGPNIAKAVRFVMDGGATRQEERLRHLQVAASEIATAIREVLVKVPPPDERGCAA